MSELNVMGFSVKPNAEQVIIENSDTKNARVFHFTHMDMDASHEDIYGWNFKSNDGIKLLLIND